MSPNRIFNPEMILRKYKEDLYENFLPFMDKHIIDHTYGGFKCHSDRDGRNITTNKRTWFDGRGVWVYSYLYNYFRKDPQYLTIAKKTLDLLSRARKGKRLWPWEYDENGSDLEEQAPDIYGNLFVAEGLIEFSIASGDPSRMEEAKEILFDMVDLYDSEDYLYIFRYRKDVPAIKMPRVLGHWMILMSIGKSILKYHPEDKKVKSLVDRCLDALLNHHLNPEFNLMIEFLEKDMTLPESALNQFVYIGHSIEVLWMIMDEAERREDGRLFEKAASLFKRHVEVAWDNVYGGVFHGLINVNRNEFLLDKVFWAQQEVLIGLLILIERKDDAWAKTKFMKMFDYVQDKFNLKKHGLDYWNLGGDRKMTFEEHCSRIENYHVPRHLMLNIQRLEMICGRNASKE